MFLSLATEAKHMQLNLPEFDLKVRKTREGKKEIFDVFRKKYLVLTPEEWVRQNFLHFLRHKKGFPQSLISVEKGMTVNRMQKRFDAVVYGKQGEPLVLLEFKAPDVPINQKVFEQIAAYNIMLKVRYLVVSNGLNHYCCRMDYENHQYSFVKEIPDYQEL
jgi:hypothetical protein